MKKLLFKLGLYIQKISGYRPVFGSDDQKIAEKACIDYGHTWCSSFDAKKEIAKPLKERVYCKRCGKVYSEVHYKK